MEPTPRFARTILIPVSTLIFFVGLLLASRAYFSGQPRTFADALISWLQSPGSNPHGYLFATCGTAASAVLLAPVGLMFHRRLTVIGALFFAAGLLAAVLIGCLAPFPNAYEPLHIPLAYTTFICIAIGLAVCAAVAAKQARNTVAMGLAAFMGAVVLFLFYLLLVSDAFFDNQHWYTSMAFLEWLLCVGNAAYTYYLAALVEHDA